MRRKLIKFASSSLTNIGINHSSDNTSPRTLWRLILPFGYFSAAGLSTFMAAVTNTNDFYTFVNPSPYIAGATVILTGVYFMYLHRQPIGRMFHQMDLNFYTYPDESLLRVKYPWYLQEDLIIIALTLAKYSLFFVWIIDSLPIFVELFCFGEIRTAVYPRWTPWKMHGLRAEFFMFVLQSTQAMCGLWFNYVILSFQLVVVTEFVRQYVRLNAAVGSIQRRTSVLVVHHVSGERSSDYDGMMRRNIVHCIRHHQALHKNFNSYKMWFSGFFSVELAISVVTFAFALYVLINAPSLSDMLNYFAVILLIWTNLLVRCLLSEIFFNLNDSLAQTLLCKAPWHQTTRENGKLFVMFHALASQQPLRLFGLSIFEASRVTFAQLVRMTYSFVNVLNLSLKK